MGRGGRSTAATLSLRAPARGTTLSWWQPAERRTSKSANTEMAMAHRALVRVLGRHRDAMESSWPHPVLLHDDDPIVPAARRLAVASIARSLYLTPARCERLLDKPLLCAADAEVLQWARRNLSSQPPGLPMLTRGVYFSHASVALAAGDGTAEALVAGDEAAALRGARLDIGGWRGFLLAAAHDVAFDPRRLLFEQLAGASTSASSR